MVRRHPERESDVKKWLGILWLPLLCGASFAQTSTYPDRPITLIVTAAAGGVTDVAARAVGQELSKAWGQPVIVENRGGAAHILGAQSVAKADPDGYTLMVGEAGTFTINPTVYPPGKLPYDTDKDFIPISGLVRINQALIGDNNLPAANAAELIALAKQKPGQLTYGTAGIGSAPHMNMALFESMAGVKLQAVHYRGAAPALNDLAGGSINLMSVSVSLALPAFRGGRVKMLGIGSDKRIAQASDIPTVAESGLPGYQAVTWFGLFGPAKLPPDLVGKLNAQVAKIFADPDFRAHFLEPQMFEAMPGSPEEFAAYIQSERAKWAKVIHEANITLE
jgi:tripartite-type tricarboxylate transporter receptor subunit TctC